MDIKNLSLDDIKEKIKKIIVESLFLDIDIKTIDSDKPLFDKDNGLGLDSVDVLELVAQFEENFGVVVEEGKKEIFDTISTLADYIFSELHK